MLHDFIYKNVCVQYEEALDIVEQSAAPLSEELGERLAAPAGAAGCDALLRRLADLLGARGLYHQAARRLAHVGDKVRARRVVGTNGLLVPVLVKISSYPGAETASWQMQSRTSPSSLD